METSQARLKRIGAPNTAWRKARLSVIGVVVLALAAAGGSYFLKLHQERLQHEREAGIEKAAKAMATESGRRLHQRLDSVDASMPAADLATVLASGDPDSIASKEAELTALDDVVLAARLLAPGFDRVDYDAHPPLTYATLDFLRRSEDNQKPEPPEVHLFGSESQYLAVLRRLEMEDGTLAGHLFLALDVSVLADLVDASKARGGYAALVQPVDKGPPLVLDEHGRKQLRQGRASFWSRVPGTRWELHYWAKRRQADGQGMLPGDPKLWAVAGGGFLLALLGLAAVRRRTRRATTESVQRAIARQKAQQRRAAAPDQLSEKLAALESGPVGGAEDGQPGIVVVEEGAGPAPQSGPEPSGDPPSAEQEIEIPESIFRAYDIRGVVGQSLNEEIVRLLGKAIGSEAYDRGQQTLAVACDGRHSGPELKAALIQGLLASGRDVIDVGRLPTPVLYFATHYLDTGSGVMVTGSHNPPDYNGLKIMLGGDTLFGDDIAALRTRIVSKEFATGSGTMQSMEVIDEYIRRISEDVPVALGNAFKVVIDCGNGVAGEVAPKLFRALGHDVVELYCDVDGNFPNHHPDPSQPENLKDLIAAVQESQADLGFAFDGDGDRLGVVDSRGHIVWPDRQLMLFAVDVLRRNPQAEIIFDVKCSSRLPKIIKAKGGKPVMCKTGHSYIKNKLKESGAPLAGEMSGHIFFKERWYGFDDAVYAAARLLEILMAVKREPSAVFSKLPAGVNTPELRVDMEEGRNFRFMEELLKGDRFQDGKVTTIDGVRVDYKDAWGLVRASNTTPSLVLRFEGDDQEALARVQEKFRSALLDVDQSLVFPF